MERMKELPGVVGYYYKNLNTGEEESFQSDSAVIAASVIKIPIMAALFDEAEKGHVSLDTMVTLTAEDKLPSCGAITYLHDGLQLTLEDVCVLMIILSDNSATNFLIRYLGRETIQRWIDDNGYQEIRLNRKLFDSEASARGIENYITAGSIGNMLEAIWKGELVSKKASARMLEILGDQRLNGKLPFFLHSLEDGPCVAHKTGEDSGITHDCGIIYDEEDAWILCVTGWKTDVPRLERCMQDAALEIYNKRKEGN
ncbi:MAG: serine hydrolase [Lachnospiraceae bacterium]|nr:serine hydrolase [Lachnospiraceae bacterium]